MPVFRINYTRFCRLVNYNFTRANLSSLTKAHQNKKILLGLGLIGLSPVVPFVSAQSQSSKEESTQNSKQNSIEDKGTSKSLDTPKNEKTPWERVKAIFETDEFGHVSKEMNLIYNTCYMAMFVGALYGGVQQSKIAFTDFMERNQATLFDNHLEAKRKLQNHVTIHFGKGAISWATKATVFSGGFMCIFLCLHAYRGSATLKDYTISAAMIGAVTRVKLGPRGILVGGALGGILGLFCGLMNQSFLSLLGISYDDILAAQYNMDSDRSKIFDESKTRDFENRGLVPKYIFEFLKTHDDKPKEI